MKKTKKKSKARKSKKEADSWRKLSKNSLERLWNDPKEDAVWNKY